MDGVFLKGRFSAVSNILGLISGLFLAALFGWLLLSGEFQTLDDRLLSAFFACFGILVALFCGLSLLVNRKACIHADDKRITAFCHYGLKLSCTYSEIHSVTYGGTGLHIRLVHGKRYNLMHLENACALGRYIENRIPTQQDAVPLSQIPSLRAKCKWEGICAMAGFPLLIPLAVLTSALTGWKELHQFYSRDWRVFATLGGCVPCPHRRHLYLPAPISAAQRAAAQDPGQCQPTAAAHRTAAPRQRHRSVSGRYAPRIPPPDRLRLSQYGGCVLYRRAGEP